MVLLERKVAGVIGGGSGIGEAVARLFGTEEANAAIGDVADSAAAAASEITAGGGPAIFVRTNVPREDSVAALMQAVGSGCRELTCGTPRA